MGPDPPHPNIVDIVVRQRDLDFSVRNNYGQSLAQLAVLSGELSCVEILANTQECDCWNIPDEKGDSLIMLL